MDVALRNDEGINGDKHAGTSVSKAPPLLLTLQQSVESLRGVKFREGLQ